jgi:hypothetical protein
VRRFVGLTSAIMLIFCLLLGITRGIGSLIQPSPLVAMFQSDGCSVWECWHGIRFEMTNHEVYNLLTADKNIILAPYLPGNANVCWWWQGQELNKKYTDLTNCYKDNYDGKKHSELQLRYSHTDLRLGDLIALLGSPLSASRCQTGIITFSNVRRLKLIVVYVDIDDFQKSMTPDLKVKGLSLYERPEESFENWSNSVFQWHGFVQWKNIPVFCG